MTEGIFERFGADILTRLEAGPVEVVAAHRQRGPVRLQLTLEVGALGGRPAAARAAATQWRHAAASGARRPSARLPAPRLLAPPAVDRHAPHLPGRPPPQDVKERMAVDIAAACARLRAAGAVSLLTVHGLDDRTIPPRDARLFAEALPGSALVLVEGGDHNFTGDAAGVRLVAAAVEFLAAGEG
jgi:fermentation-respiration switch protein FrsA (DUF1100 family)